MSPVEERVLPGAAHGIYRVPNNSLLSYNLLYHKVPIEVQDMIMEIAITVKLLNHHHLNPYKVFVPVRVATFDAGLDVSFFRTNIVKDKIILEVYHCQSPHHPTLNICEW